MPSRPTGAHKAKAPAAQTSLGTQKAEVSNVLKETKNRHVKSLSQNGCA